VAWAGVDAASWDIIGKAGNPPVYQILTAGEKPSPRIRMPASGRVEYAWYKRLEDPIDEAVRHKEEGYTAFKFLSGPIGRPAASPYRSTWNLRPIWKRSFRSSRGTTTGRIRAFRLERRRPA
jgi:L-alanine-DL-glutamate epimerase-like enolase superfamily enzyme